MGAPPKPGKFNCVKCEYTCSSKPTIDNHIKTVHEVGVSFKTIQTKKRNITTFQCEECDSTFHTKSKLNLHTKTEHKGEKKDTKGRTSPPLSPEHKKLKEQDNDLKSNDENEDKKEKREDEDLIERLRELREEDEKEDQAVLNSMVDKEKLDKEDRLNKIIQEKNKLIEILTKNKSDREATLTQENKELKEAKLILTNHTTKLKEKLTAEVENAQKVLEELKSRKVNQAEWISYARKYKIKSRILEVQLKKEKQKNEPNTVETDVSQETIEPEDMDNEDIFHTEEDMVTGVENKSEIQGVFRCTPCEKIFKKEGNFREHIRTKHVNEDQEEYACENCDFKTDCSQLLSNHMTFNHTPVQEEMKCPVCDEQFTVKIEYETHLQIGHIQTESEEDSEQNDIIEEETLIKCHGTPGRKCQDKFKTKEELMKHRKLVHPSTLVCQNFPGCKWGNECIHVHPEEMDLDTQTQVEETKISCRLCNAKFSGKHNLMMHRKTEHIERVNKCRDFQNSTCSRTLCWYKHEQTREVQPHKVQAPAPAPPSASVFPSAWPSLQPPEQNQTTQMIHQMMQMQIQMQKQIADLMQKM